MERSGNDSRILHTILRLSAENDKIDFSVGLQEVIDVGSQVDTLTPLLTIHAKSKESVNNIKEQMQKCFNITNQNIPPLKMIYNLVS